MMRWFRGVRRVCSISDYFQVVDCSTYGASWGRLLEERGKSSCALRFPVAMTIMMISMLYHRIPGIIGVNDESRVKRAVQHPKPSRRHEWSLSETTFRAALEERIWEGQDGTNGYWLLGLNGSWDDCRSTLLLHLNRRALRLPRLTNDNCLIAPTGNNFDMRF